MTHEFMPADESASNPIVFVQDGRAWTNTRTVAITFGKRHADVIRSVRRTIAARPELSQRIFALAEYTDDQGKPRVAYDMNRDGFALLAMGFTGAAALAFKLAYIDAFNRMEAALQDNAPPDHTKFPNWPLDVMRARTAVADLYRQAYGTPTCQWAMTTLLGYPAPPPHLVTTGRQRTLPFVDPDDDEQAA
jgi:Rha family phage regulatory protein